MELNERQYISSGSDIQCIKGKQFAVPSRLKFSGDTTDTSFPPALTFDSI